jgi:hypothetical protein
MDNLDCIKLTTVTTASAPFDDPNADHVFTIQSSDGVQFHTHRCILTLASPVFRDMLSLPQPTVSADTNRADIPELSEDSVVLHTLLSCCDPRIQPDLASLRLEDVVKTLHAGIKYQMKYVGPMLLPQIKAHITKVPLQVYAIAIQGIIMYRDAVQDGVESQTAVGQAAFRDLAKDAAKELLNYPIPFKRRTIMEVPLEFDQIPARYLENLYTYHAACGDEAAKLARSPGTWCSRFAFGMWRCAENPGCSMKYTYEFNSSPGWYIGKWWGTFTNSSAEALQRTPHPDIMLARTFFNLDTESATSYICINCRLNYYKTIPQYCQLAINKLTEEINNVRSLYLLCEQLSN